MTLWAGVRTGARSVLWYLKGLLGEDAYEKYVAHHAALHAAGADGAGADGADGGAPHALMTEREFWRDQTDRQDQNPQGRCC
jgi:uncharacterized short protein YbdD (DUF466 family)